jgi:hypothetical protein
MAIAKTEILAQTRRLLDETTETYWTDTELNEWIDRGCRRLSQCTLAKWDTEDVTLVASQLKYSLTKYFLTIESALYDVATNGERKGLQRMRPPAIGNSGVVTSGVPNCYWPFGNTYADNGTTVTKGCRIYIYPVPTASEAAKLVSIYGYVIPLTYGAGGSETLPVHLQQDVVNFALSCAYTKLGKHRKAGILMQNFINKCIEERRKRNERIGLADTIDMASIPDYTINQQG